MAHIKNGYPITETNQNGTQITTVYYSTNPGELSNMAAGMTDNKYIRVVQRSENGIHELEVVEQVNTDGETAEKPNKNFGSKNPSLHGALLSLPLEQHPKYRVCWNYFLFGKSGNVPSWWSTATSPVTNEDNYLWGQRIGECPARWKILKAPTKHANHYEIPTYVMQETANYRSFQQAASALGSKVGRIATPSHAISVTGGRNWRCDEGRIEYDGKKYIGTFSYTLSGPGGWDSDFYQ